LGVTGHGVSYLVCHFRGHSRDLPRAREGLINYMHGRGRHDFAWEMIPQMDGGCSRVVALWKVIGAMERHFGDHPAHMHTKQSRQQFARVGVCER